METKNKLNKQLSLRGVIAGLLVIGGLMCGIYYLAIFDPSVEVPSTEIAGETFGGGRVNNLGLMQDRQNGIYLGFGAAALGLAIEFFGRRPKEESGSETKKEK